MTIEGTARDVSAGVDRVVVTFTSSSRTTTRAALLTCTDDHGACSWRVRPPEGVDSWTVHAHGVDRFDNAGAVAGPITVFVVGHGS